ncbi:outer membrane protein assembly factor BamB family protein [Acidicapsa acidisoli]|uniref:outer membrane protein assembly factor BamB family protein n=1 Tax=Acidicapsa acidisoli TaxID=1615681 RepID=UPI0021DF8316|nr:PQQ-binding-like beta-propeller repeat protein [Acidicapsa acidisoli]
MRKIVSIAGITYRLRFFALLVLAIVSALVLLFGTKLRDRWKLLGLVLLVLISVFLWRGQQKQAEQLLMQTVQAGFGDDRSPQSKAPYSLYRHPIRDHEGMPCTPGLWGTVTALNLQTGKIVWERPHGRQEEGVEAGSLSLGGVIVTAGGLVFAAGTREPLLRAYDSSSGEELWKGNLPAPAQSTPMTYEVNGRQFVVIAAGGHGMWGTKTGDAVVAFTTD